MKRSIIFLLTFAIFSFVFASCSDLARDASAGGIGGTAAGAANGGIGGTAAAQKYASVTGTAFASGAFPEEIAAALNKIPASSAGMTNSPATSKSAFPQMAGADLQGFAYKFTAVKVGDETVRYEAAQGDISVSAEGLVSYSVNIPVLDAAVQYKIVCEAYLDAEKTKPVLKGESQKFEIGRESQTASASVPLGAIQESGCMGSVELLVALESGAESAIDSATMTISGLSSIAGVLSGSEYKFSSDANAVPCGARSARFSFKKGSQEVYAFTQIVNVYQNLETKTWVQNGAEPYFNTTVGASGNKSTVCKLTAALLEGWKLTEIFVDASRSADPTKANYSSQSGTFINPCLTFDGALSKLVDKNKDYTIFINGTVTGAQAVPSTLKSDGSGETNARSLTISGANGLYTSGPNAGQPKDTLDADGYGSALCVQTNVSVSIKDLRITGADDDGVSGLAILDDGVNVTLLDGTLITGNESDKGGGVHISAGSLDIKGAVISGNSATDSGGGIYNEGGSVTFYSGSIESNYAICYGGGVCNDSGSFEMKDGAVITQNSANDAGDGSLSSGGGIFVFDGSVTVSGGTISANTTNGLGGAVRVFDGAFSVGGSASIPYGTGNDIYLDEDQSIAIASALNSNFAALITLPDDDYKTGTQVLTGDAMEGERYKFRVKKPDSKPEMLFIGSDGKLVPIITFSNGSNYGTVTNTGTEENPGDGLEYDVYKYSYIDYSNIKMSIENPYENDGYSMELTIDSGTPALNTNINDEVLEDGFHTIHAKFEKSGEETMEITKRVYVGIRKVSITLYDAEIKNFSKDYFKGGVYINGREVRRWNSWTDFSDTHFNTYSFSEILDKKDSDFICSTADAYMAGSSGGKNTTPLRDAYRVYKLSDLIGGGYIEMNSGTYNNGGHASDTLTLAMWYTKANAE